MPNNDSVTVQQRNRSNSGWRGVVLVTATYFYFLIFAQFGFLKRLNALGLSDAHLKAVMAVMAIGGILASLLTPRKLEHVAPKLRLQLAFAGCATASLLTLLPLHLFSGMGVAALIGLSLGILTVTLVTHLPAWIGDQHSLLKIALGTGIGYFLSNIPGLFSASAHVIAFVAAAATAICIPLTAEQSAAADPPLPSTMQCSLPFLLVMLWFTALVWFDSAMFFTLQHAPTMESGAWTGSAHLWRTGCIHLLAALLSAWLLTRRGLPFTLLSAYALLASAALFLRHPQSSAPAAWLYPIGISLYSVALVAYPAYLLAVLPRDRGLRAGWIYAIAGWIGSVMGIGMAQHLHRVPLWFVGAAGVLFLLPLICWLMRRFWRESVAILLVVGSAALLYGAMHLFRAPQPQLSAIERGRRVYIGEGCIHCHSQYVRPDTQDTVMWGPVSAPSTVQQEKPPLIGNRRQGPDLSNVGSRRSSLWLRIHLIDPRAVSPYSIMPSYAYLFRSSRGNDLVAYLSSLRSPDSVEHLRHELSTWQPRLRAKKAAAHLNGNHLFQEYCATCHSTDGYTRQHWGKDFAVIPTDLATARLQHFSASDSQKQIQLALERTIKFGIPGTDMPGHEYLPDAQVIALAKDVIQLRDARR